MRNRSAYSATTRRVFGARHLQHPVTTLHLALPKTSRTRSTTSERTQLKDLSSSFMSSSLTQSSESLWWWWKSSIASIAMMWPFSSRKRRRGMETSLRRTKPRESDLPPTMSCSWNPFRAIVCNKSRVPGEAEVLQYTGLEMNRANGIIYLEGSLVRVVIRWMCRVRRTSGRGNPSRRASQGAGSRGPSSSDLTNTQGTGYWTRLNTLHALNNDDVSRP